MILEFLVAFAFLFSIASLVYGGVNRLISNVRRMRQKKSAVQAIRQCVTKHQDVLARKRFQLVTTDDYGVVRDEGWKKEVLFFFNNVVFPDLTEENLVAILEDMDEIVDSEVEARIRLLSESLNQELAFTEDMSPIEFEHFVAMLFRKAGWSAEVSQASGDQGADVIAENGDRRAVIQCKLYSKPVGNKAVQEVVAARTFYHANLACVISNSSFTRSARQLAASSNINLLHFSDVAGFLSDFDTRPV